MFWFELKIVLGPEKKKIIEEIYILYISLRCTNLQSLRAGKTNNNIITKDILN